MGGWAQDPVGGHIIVHCLVDFILQKAKSFPVVQTLSLPLKSRMSSLKHCAPRSVPSQMYSPDGLSYCLSQYSPGLLPVSSISYLLFL